MRNGSAGLGHAALRPCGSSWQREFRQGKETGVLERGRTVAETGEIGVMACESEERGNAVMPIAPGSRCSRNREVDARAHKSITPAAFVHHWAYPIGQLRNDRPRGTLELAVVSGSIDL